MWTVVVADRDVCEVCDHRLDSLDGAACGGEGHTGDLERAGLEGADEGLHLRSLEAAGLDHAAPLADRVAADRVRPDAELMQRARQETVHQDDRDPCLLELCCGEALREGGVLSRDELRVEVLAEEVGDVFDPRAEVCVDAWVEEGDLTSGGDQALGREPEVAATVEGPTAFDDAASLGDALLGGVKQREARGPRAYVRLSGVEGLDELRGRLSREEEALWA